MCILLNAKFVKVTFSRYYIGIALYFIDMYTDEI